MGNSQSTGQISAAPTSAAGATALPPPPVLAPAAAPPAPTAPAPAPGDRAPAPPPPPGTVNNGPAMTAVATPPPQQELPPPPPESGPGTFEDLHKVTKDLFPVPFEGGKLLVNKGLSNHFQVSHSLAMSTLQPSGYKFGCTYVGTHQVAPNESYPVLLGDIDFGGNLNANIMHQVTRALKCKFVAQIENQKWRGTQLTGEYNGKDYTACLTVGNPDLLNGSGVLVAQYMQSVTQKLDLGAELLYQRGAQVPGGQIGIYTIAGRYTGDEGKWRASFNVTPAAGGVHTCYSHKINDNLSVGAEVEGSIRTRDVTGTVAYQIDLPSADLTFRGSVDSNYCVGGVLEKKLQPLPFTFALSAFANHAKGNFRFGVGLIVG